MNKVVILGRGKPHRDVLLKCLLLEAGNYSVDIPKSGGQTIEALKSSPQLVILNIDRVDAQLADLVGKVNRICPKTMILIISETVDPQSFSELVKDQVYFFQRPFSPYQFHQAVRTIIENKDHPKRNSPRFPAKVKTSAVNVDQNLQSEIEVIDIGYHGLQAKVRGNVFKQGERVRLVMPGLSVPKIPLAGTVRWCKQSQMPRGQNFGIEFDSITEAELVDILAYRRPTRDKSKGPNE